MFSTTLSPLPLFSFLFGPCFFFLLFFFVFFSFFVYRGPSVGRMICFLGRISLRLRRYLISIKYWIRYFMMYQLELAWFMMLRCCDDAAVMLQ